MVFIGITGGIGMGKSTVADYLARRGEMVIDTDVLARELVLPGHPAFNEITAAFGEGVLRADGTLDRKQLASQVFVDDGKRKVLEDILHPRIRNAWREWAAEEQRAGVQRAMVVIPLLFETGAEKELDLTLCVACSAASQRERLLKRGWTQDEIDRRIAAQLPVREKIERADRVVWSEGPIPVGEMQVEKILASLAPFARESVRG